MAEAGETGARKGRWWKRLLLVCGSLLFTLFVLEVGIRVVASIFYPKMMQFDAVLGWSHVPDRERVFPNEHGEKNVVTINSLGLRGPEPAEKRGHEKRVLVLGDSFTEGVHVAQDQLYTSVLGAALPDVEIVNCGVSGYGTVQQFLYLRERGLALDPDAVIVVTFENDLSDNCIPFFPTLGPRPFVRVDGERAQIVEDYPVDEFLEFVAPVPGQWFLRKHSYLFYFFNDKIYGRFAGDAQKELCRQKIEAVPTDVRHRAYAHTVRECANLLASKSIGFGVVLIPQREEVASGSAPWIEKTVSGCEAAGVPSLSLLPAMTAASAKGTKPYFDRDIHWSKDGHAVAGKAMVEFVRARLAR